VKRNSIRIIVLLASVLFAGLVLTQVFWVRKAYTLQERQLDYDITKSLKNVAQQILIHNQDSAQLYDPVEQVSDKVFRVRIQESLEPVYLESLLSLEFRKEEINLEFEYSIYDCFNDSVLFSRNVGFTQEVVPGVAPEFDWQNDAHYFGVYFPNKDDQVLAGLNFWFFSSTLLLLVLLFFSWTIWLILRQKRLSEIKNDFINNMTHELKTPISTISLSSKMLLKEDLDAEKRKNFAQIIDKENDRLSLQVEKVLQIATLEKEKLELNVKAVDMHVLIQECLTVFSLSMEEKGGEFQLDLQAKNSLMIGDEVHLTNILHNLVDNAIKYSPEAPRVEIKSWNEGKHLLVQVRDEGIGMDPLVGKKIFEKFYREPQGNIHDVKGFGLGLFYVKNMVKAHSGNVSLKSEVGSGSSFTLKFKSNGK
jgi:two-component system phosphate regulon sensor histidine kinase PhoR